MARSQKEHQKGMKHLGQIRGHLEAGGVGTYHFCGFLQSGGTGSAPVWGGDMGIVSVHAKADIEGPHVFLWQVMGKQARRLRDETWRCEGSESILKVAGTKDIRT